MPPLCIGALSSKILHLTEEEEGGGGGGVDNGTFKTFNPTFVTFKQEKKHQYGQVKKKKRQKAMKIVARMNYDDMLILKQNYINISITFGTYCKFQFKKKL